MIVVPAQKLSGLGADGTVPNPLYDLFQHRYGLTVSHADEQIEGVSATSRVACPLNAAVGTPLLKVNQSTVEQPPHD